MKLSMAGGCRLLACVEETRKRVVSGVWDTCGRLCCHLNATLLVVVRYGSDSRVYRCFARFIFSSCRCQFAIKLLSFSLIESKQENRY